MSKEISYHLCTRLKDVTNFRTKTNKGTTDFTIHGELNDIPVGITVQNLTSNTVRVEVSACIDTRSSTLGFATVVEDVAVTADNIVSALQDCVDNVDNIEKKYVVSVYKSRPIPSFF